jgi:hypothetical protein
MAMGRTVLPYLPIRAFKAYMGQMGFSIGH